MGKVDYASMIQPFPGQSYCGDMAWIKKFNNYLLLCLIDVAGHGYDAEKHAEECAIILENHFKEDLAQIIHHLNKYSQGKKPLVIGLTLIDISSGLIHNITIGNITTRIIGKQGYRFFSPAGTLGSSAIKLIWQDYFLNDKDVVIMHSDGVSNRFEKIDYPDILTDRIDIVPSKIIQQFAKNNDDSSCIAMRYFA